MEAWRQMVLEVYDRFIGLQVTEIAVDCCITEKVARNPVDSGQGTKRSMAVDEGGIPLGTVTAPAKAATTRRYLPRPSTP
jgi:hypothetical protein